MAKAFFEALPGLSVPQGLSETLKKAVVERVTASADRSVVRIYLDSPRIISKRDIYRLEAAVKKQLFPNKDLAVRIHERFRLSSQYTLETLTDVYRESMLLEVKRSGMLLYSLMKETELTFPEEGVVLCNLPDSILSRDRGAELKAYLEKVYTERCGLQADVRLIYEKELPARHKDEVRAALKAEAAQIAEELAENGEKETGEQNAEASAPVGTEKKKAAAEKTAGGAGKKPAAAGKERGRSFLPKKGDDPDLLYGRPFDQEITPMAQILSEMGEITVTGEIFRTEERQLKSGSFLVLFNLTDLTDSISVKMFVKEDDIDGVRGFLKDGTWVTVCGVTTVDRFDGELCIQSVRGLRRAGSSKKKRVDTAPRKRVELHCHTKMSEMDGISDVTDLMTTARAWGHTAMAITDHGVVQSFPIAFHKKQDWDGKLRTAYAKEHPEADKKEIKAQKVPFKLIYGVEGYLVNDQTETVVRSTGQDFDVPYVVFDLETTGFSAANDRIIEIGAVRVEGGEITARFSTFVNPHIPIPPRIEELTSISDEMVLPAPDIETVLPEFLQFCEGAVMVAHNASFDMSFIAHNAQTVLGREFAPTVVDTVSAGRIFFPDLSNYKLDTLAKAVGVKNEHHHRAVDDAECTAKIFLDLLRRAAGRGMRNLSDLNEAGRPTADQIRRMHPYHVILLAQTEEGRVNLYRLVSEAHLNYFGPNSRTGRPKIPKTLLSECRSGILVGSACEAGELYQAIERGMDDSELAQIASFYDYLEIQPLGNNRFKIASDKSPVQSDEDLREINRKIVQLGEKLGKPVAATGDVHFLEPQDEIYRAIIMHGKGYADAQEQPPLYFKTTDEMLEEFDYLGTDKAYEVVVENTNRIADSIDDIEPVRPDKCPPVIPDSDKTLREICYNKAHEMYGDPLPEIVANRLEKELTSIIGNGYAVMYIIAQKLVWKSNEDGYLVGSRGSVGSSFVATMAGITEVNPLSPHYYCPSCHYSDFDSPEVRAFAGMAGCDMPDKVCPVCGKPLKKDGFDIPFETFLGFYGDKEPDIDLNFSGEYQSRAHDYTEVIFGKGHTFRAGTIGTLAEKTAFGLVKKFVEETGRPAMRKCEIERLALGCTGVKRTTGQHPGGIVVMPHGENIYSFTPIQHPANDMTTKTVTTHFEYHSIDHNLLKLDILGHDDPTMIRMLQDLIGMDPRQIPLDAPEVMSLFRSTEALGIRPEDIGGTTLGALGIPEFGTDFAMQMLIDTQPKYFSDLVRIAGLAHGTDVWLGNAQDLILSGTATIQEAICCRDDIMIYLIQKGLEPGEAFTIMENVRKGKFKKDKGKMEKWIADMEEKEVPEWYIDSCKKIQYMFPKAHAAAYVMMAWRIAWCKIHYPLAYYTAYFTIRASGFSYELMCMGREALEIHLESYKRRMDQLTDKEQDSLRDMRIVQEMYARGYEFTPIDIYTADAKKFRIVDGKIMPSLSSIDGMGEKAAEGLAAAAAQGKFLSREDLCQRSKISSSMADTLVSLGLLSGMPATNQISIFDLME